MTLQKIWTKDFITLSLNNFFTFLSFYVLATAFPLFIKEVMNGSGQQIGLVITIFVMGNIGIRPLAGLWVDRYGARKIMIIGFAVFCAASFAYLGAQLIYILFALRFIHGISHGLATTASNTLVTSVIPEEKMGQGIGYFSMFMSLAMVIGPAMGLSVWEHYGEDGLLWCGAIVGFLTFFFAFITKAPTVKKQPVFEKKKLQVSDFFETKAIPASLVVLLLAFSYASLTSFLSLFTKENDLSNYTSFFFIVFALLILIPRPVVGKIFDNYGAGLLVYPAIISFTVGMLILSQASAGWLLLLAAAFMGLGHGILIPAYQTIAMNAVSFHRRGIAAATYFMLFDVGYGIGSYVLGIVSNITGYRTMFFISAIIVLLSAPLYHLIVQKKAISTQ